MEEEKIIRNEIEENQNKKEQEIQIIEDNQEEREKEEEILFVLYYLYISIEDPFLICKYQKDLCFSLHLKGRIRISTEGINGTLSLFIIYFLDLVVLILLPLLSLLVRW